MQYKNTCFLSAIVHQEHKIIKYAESIITFINNNDNNASKSATSTSTNKKITTQLMCQKIITLAANDHQGKIRVQNQIECITDYIQRKYNCAGKLQMPIRLDVFIEHEQKSVIIKLNMKYIEYQTLSQYFKKRMFQSYAELINVPQTDLVNQTIYMMEELFEIVVGAGGIDNFFYTPKNIFINPIKKDSEQKNSFDINKLEINHFSMVGLKFLTERGSINREEFEEIYPSLPPNFFSFPNNTESLLQINVLIKKRGLAYLILCCLLQRIPELINVKSFDQSLSPEQVKRQLGESKTIFSCLINLYRAYFQKLKQIINVDFTAFFTKIFIENCVNYTWEDIYHDLFQKNCINIKALQAVKMKSFTWKFNSEQAEGQCKQQVKDYIDRFWNNEKNKKFYVDRELFLVQPRANQLSTLYLIVKFNVNFHRTLRYINMIEELRNSKFSSDQNKANINFFNVINDEVEADDSISSTIEEDVKLVESGMIYKCSKKMENGEKKILISLDEKQKILNQLMSTF